MCQPGRLCFGGGGGCGFSRLLGLGQLKGVGGGGDQQERTGAGQTVLHGEVHSSGQKQPSPLKNQVQQHPVACS